MDYFKPLCGAPQKSRTQIVFGVKLFAVGGIILLMLWLLEKYVI
jgi:hypothetical protein